MNDFTKEELINIMVCFDIADKTKLILRIYEFYQLEKKIMLMIDNYCEHENHVAYTTYGHFCSECEEFIRFD